MPLYYALAKSDNSFIVSAETREGAEQKLNAISKKHGSFYQKNIATGYYIVRADSLKEAKTAKKHISYDLPLFTTTGNEFFVFEETGDDSDGTLMETCSSLDDALNYFKNKPNITGTILLKDLSGKQIKEYKNTEIRDILAEKDLAERKKRHRTQLRLF